MGAAAVLVFSIVICRLGEVNDTCRMMVFLAQREGILLVLTSPFLMFPTVFWPGTVAALLSLILLWFSLWVVDKRPWPVSPLNGALLLWGLAVIGGMLGSDFPDLTLPKATGLVLGMAILRYLADRGEEERRLKWGTAAFFAVGFLIAVVGTFSVDWQFEAPLVEMISGRLPPRLISLPEGPVVGVHMNQLAGALLPYPLVFISLLFGWKPERQAKLIKFGLVVLTGLLLVLIFISQSRSGWLGFGVGLAGLAVMKVWWSFRSARRLLVGVGTGLAVIFLAASVLFTRSDGWVDLWQRPPQETAVGDLSTLDFRREVWFWGVRAVEEFPLTGTGLGTFRRAAAERYPLAVPADFDIAHAHNIFLQVALDAGLPGLTGYFGLLIIMGVVGWRAAGKEGEMRPFILGLLAAIIAVHAYGLGDALAPGSKPGVVFWLMMGLIMRIGKRYG